MAIAGIGFAVTAAPPASAQYNGATGGFGDYAGVYNYGRPYGTHGLAGYGGSGGYGYGDYRGAYGSTLGADRNGSGTSYGRYGRVPYFSYAGSPSYGPNHGYSFRWGARRAPALGYGVGDRLR
jgi:hypothetical protein